LLLPLFSLVVFAAAADDDDDDFDLSFGDLFGGQPWGGGFCTWICVRETPRCGLSRSILWSRNTFPHMISRISSTLLIAGSPFSVPGQFSSKYFLI
jgi:hypothetical protein